MLADYSQMALLSIILHLVFIALAWWALQAVNYEKFIRANRVMQARVLFIIVAIFLGTTVSNFFLDYLRWSQQLPLIFR